MLQHQRWLRQQLADALKDLQQTSLEPATAHPDLLANTHSARGTSAKAFEAIDLEINEGLTR